VDDTARIDELRNHYHAMRREIARVIVGQDAVVEELMIALFAGGHVLLEGVPGLAKTLLISSVARVMDLSFNRIQFTPDLMPSDITGSEVLEEDHGTGQRHFRFIRGPIFAHVILADEINRTPPKTQAALLQAMQEHQVTAGGQTHDLGNPFFVLATQNPIEQEGTYPLPEAQLDRFMLNIKIGYPSYDEEVSIVESTTGAGGGEISRGAGLPGHRPARSGGRERDQLRRQARARHARGHRAGVARGGRVPRLGRRPARRAVPRARRQGACAAGRTPDAVHR
jgi:MoxR-like ATPase